ncbi:MAG: ABC transporter ATP-binding protein [Polyangiales bacterium]
MVGVGPALPRFGALRGRHGHAAFPMIALRNVQKEFDDGAVHVPVLRGVDFEIASGEVVALLGPSGCGKSTLLNILGCLDRPTQGEYLLAGRDVSRLSREEEAWVRLHHIGFVFQSFHLIGHATALENVALPMYYAGVPRKEREERAHAMLARVGLAERARHRPNQLSGGQRQRTAIARACVMRPKLLLADEPTGALDTHSGHEVLALLTELHAETGMTIVIVTHDGRVAETAQRRIEMRDGQLVAEHALQEVADGE